MKKALLTILIILAACSIGFAADLKTYAEIQNGKVRALHKNVAPGHSIVFSKKSGLEAVDITGLDPMPDQRWKYDKATGKFSEPDPIPPPTDQEKADKKIRVEMQSAEGRMAAIARLIISGDLAADYTE